MPRWPRVLSGTNGRGRTRGQTELCTGGKFLPSVGSGYDARAPAGLCIGDGALGTLPYLFSPSVFNQQQETGPLVLRVLVNTRGPSGNASCLYPLFGPQVTLNSSHGERKRSSPALDTGRDDPAGSSCTKEGPARNQRVLGPDG